MEVYKLANELGVSSVEIIASMEKLGVPVELPNPTVSIDDAQRIRASFKKRSGFSFKNTSLFISAVVSLSLVLSINSDRVFADDTAPPQVITSLNSTVSEPTVSSLLSLKEQVVVASEAIKDSFTVMVQEKLMDLGLLSGPATGVNDKSTQQAIKSFQEKAGLEVDGMVGPKTLPKLLLGEAAYTTTGSLSTNADGPVWEDDQLKFMRVNGTYLDVLWGHVTHDKPIDTFQLYVDGELHSTIEANDCINSCSSTSGDMRFIIDGLTVDTTYEFAVVACDVDGNCSNNNPTTTQSTVDKPPVWDESLPLTVSELGTRFNLNIPVGAVTDDVEVSYYEVYVNGALSTFRTISDTRLFVLPKHDMTCGQQEVYVIAYDSIGQSSKSPITTFTRNECGTTVAASPTTTTTTTTTIPGAPTITITASEVSDGDTSSDSSLSLTFTTSASTTDFAAGDVSVSNGTLSNFSGSGTTYTATFTPSAVGATTIDVASSTFTDASTGVDNTVATQFNWTYSTTPASTTSANRWVIAVIDETISSSSRQGLSAAGQTYPGPTHNGNHDVNGAWEEFRTLWPNRKFFLIEPWGDYAPNGGDITDVSSLSPSINNMSHILIPSDFLTEAAAGQKAVYIQSTRSAVNNATNWWTEIGGSSLPSGAEVILWIDNSGSMTRNTVGNEYNAFIAAAADANVTVTTAGSTGNEDWINPFDPNYP